MKNKLFTSLAVGALAAVMCMGFAACNGDNGGAKGATVTAEQWEAAFDDSNFGNVKLEMVQSTTYGEVSASSNMTITVVGNKIHAEMTVDDGDEGMSMDMYAEELENGKFNVYMQEDEGGAWTVTETDAFGYDVDEMVGAYSMFKYEDYEYSESEKAYVPKADAEGADELPTIKFENGKLVSMTMNMEQEMQGETMTIAVSITFTYGGQTITLPEVTEEGGENNEGGEEVAV